MQLNFDATNVEPNATLEPLPEGWYNVIITKSEEKPTKGGDGSYLQIELTVLDGQFKGRKCFDRFNIKNKNQLAVEIAYKQLSAICHAVGVMQISDSAVLHNLPLQAKVALKASTETNGKQYGATNEIKGYKAIEGQVAPTAIVPPQAPIIPKTQSTVAPWNRK